MRALTLLIALTTPITIEVTSGEIAVVSWNRPDVGIEATRPVDVVQGDAGLHVTAPSAALTVRVPAGHTGGIRARVDLGSIEARGLRGDVRLETVVGDIRVEEAVAARGTAIRLRAFNGDVRLDFDAPPADARILALSLGGAIHSEVPLTRRTTAGPRFAETTTGRGDALISIDTVRGDIHLTGGQTP
jgi:hypothetical protein